MPEFVSNEFDLERLVARTTEAASPQDRLVAYIRLRDACNLRIAKIVLESELGNQEKA